MSVSLKSSPDPQPLSSRSLLILGGVVLVSMLFYLGLSANAYRVGFPLDDSWIHQTYARNLAERGEWTFLPGEVSAGSTAPLWTVLLSLGFILHLSPYIWTYFLGAVLLFGIAVWFELIIRRTISSYRLAYPLAGCLAALEWHLAWAAFSGMETALHIFLILVVMNIVLSGARNYLLAGAVTGLAVWVRPDGLTLLGPLVLVVLLMPGRLSVRMGRLFALFFGFGIFFLPYLLFNLVITGTPMPNTFYAKQAEYAAWQVLPMGERSLYFSLQFFQGISLVLIPAFIARLISAVRRAEWGVPLAAVWMFGYILVYVSRLPVYQHGRYVMPALAVFLLIGISGFFDYLPRFKAARMRAAGAAAISLLLVVLGWSSVYGALTFARDVHYIESQMVDTARWVVANVPPGARIAAHDIGALGYFGDHGIVDLAGLISPDVIPFMNDEARIAAYLDESRVQYMVAFPGWKPLLTDGCEVLFSAGNNPDVQSELGSMVVYAWGRR